MSNKLMSHGLMPLVFMLAVVLTGMWVGISNPPGDWYAELIKPVFTPPNGLFAPVWSSLYLIIGWVGWRTWLKRPTPFVWYVWLAQILVNFMWSPLFFGAHLTLLALVVLLLTTLLVAVYIWQQWSHDRLCAVLFLPYIIWLSFASVLNASIVLLN